jgi:hypothetical protein
VCRSTSITQGSCPPNGSGSSTDAGILNAAWTPIRIGLLLRAFPVSTESRRPCYNPSAVRTALQSVRKAGELLVAEGRLEMTIHATDVGSRAPRHRRAYRTGRAASPPEAAARVAR